MRLGTCPIPQTVQKSKFIEKEFKVTISKVPKMIFTGPNIQFQPVYVGPEFIKMLFTAVPPIDGLTRKLLASLHVLKCDYIIVQQLNFSRK